MSETQHTHARTLPTQSHLLIMTALVSCYLQYLRFAPLITSPRLWAEEGWTFLPALYGASFLESISYIYYRSGYFNLIPNLAAYLTQFFPISFAPAITTTTAFFIQLLPVLLILISQSKLFAHTSVRILSILIYTLSPLELLETWANTINSQIYLGLCALLILIDDFTTKKSLALHLFYSLIFACAVLTGPYAFCVFPALALSCTSKRKLPLHFYIIFAFGFLIQMISFYLAYTSEKLNPKRQFEIIDATIHDVMTLQFVESLIGKQGYQTLSSFLNESYMPLLAFIPLGLIAAAILMAKKDKEVILSYAFIVLTLLTGVALTALTSFHGRLTDRYVVYVGFILNIFIALLTAHKTPLIRYVATILLTSALLCGISEFRYDIQSTPCNAQSIHWKKAVRKLKKKGTGKLPVCPPSGSIPLSSSQVVKARESID